jgi:hypothetical protein
MEPKKKKVQENGQRGGREKQVCVYEKKKEIDMN